MLTVLNGNRFSTPDQPLAPGDCATQWTGGWWFPSNSSCQPLPSMLTGHYMDSNKPFYSGVPQPMLTALFLARTGKYKSIQVTSDS